MCYSIAGPGSHGLGNIHGVLTLTGDSVANIGINSSSCVLVNMDSHLFWVNWRWDCQATYKSSLLGQGWFILLPRVLCVSVRTLPVHSRWSFSFQFVQWAPVMPLGFPFALSDVQWSWMPFFFFCVCSSLSYLLCEVYSWWYLITLAITWTEALRQHAHPFGHPDPTHFWVRHFSEHSGSLCRVWQSCIGKRHCCLLLETISWHEQYVFLASGI